VTNKDPLENEDRAPSGSRPFRMVTVFHTGAPIGQTERGGTRQIGFSLIIVFRQATSRTTRVSHPACDVGTPQGLDRFRGSGHRCSTHP